MQTMLHDLLFALWFLLPAALANVAPIFGAVIPGLRNLNAPLDGGRTFRGKELLGKHKTWRGFVLGMLVSTITLAGQHYGFNHSDWLHHVSNGVNYNDLPVLVLGPLFGLGALGGDAIESFFKRQKGVISGEAWVPFDQLDYIFGGLLVTLPFVLLTPIWYVFIILVWFVMHLLASYIGFLLGLKAKPI